MKIGVISDTHIPEKADFLPEKLIVELKRCDMVIHAGDMVSIEVAQALKKICPNFKAVSGNMDYAAVRKDFPERDIVRVGKFKIGIKHGFGPPGQLLSLMEGAFKDEGVDIVIFGHSHNPFNEKKGKTIFLNPGSPTDEIFAPYKSFGIIEIGDKIEISIIKL